MYPKSNRSNQTQNYVKSEENTVLDIGWNEGILSDGRPYRAECWAEDQVTMLTFFSPQPEWKNIRIPCSKNFDSLI